MVYQRWASTRKTYVGATGYKSGGYKKGGYTRGTFSGSRLGYNRTRVSNVQRRKVIPSYRAQPYSVGKSVGSGRSVVSKREVLSVLNSVRVVSR